MNASRCTREESSAAVNASRPSGSRMKPAIAKKCAATQAVEPIDAAAPSTVDSSCHGRTAGYARNSTPATASAMAPARIRLEVVVMMVLLISDF